MADVRGLYVFEIDSSALFWMQVTLFTEVSLWYSAQSIILPHICAGI